MDNNIEIQGVVESVIYQNPQNGYAVFSIIPEDSDMADEITCVAYIGDIFAGENVRLSGRYTLHNSYGEQFNVVKFDRFAPASVFGIEKYLGSGLIKGIGKKLAKKIVGKFKENTLHVIEDFPERLSQINGITLEKALNIGIIFREQEEQRKAILYLQNFNISPVYAVKIYEKYKENTISIVKSNPYKLADDIFGIGFHIADNIAYKAGFDRESPFRIKAGILYTLNQASNNGHVYLPQEVLAEQSAELLGVPGDMVSAALMEMQIDRSLLQERISDKIAVYLNSFYYAENYTAKKLLEISNNYLPVDSSWDDKIKAIEDEEGIALADEQKTAVLEALKSGVLVITGGPGTGKTTIIKTIIKIIEADGYKIELAAPTGRAAKRMTETTGREAKTIHRLLGIYFSNTDNRRHFFERNEENEIDADIIIIDETSMVDIMLMHSLLKAVPQGARLILVGDADQLPSVGPGNVLKDIINSDIIKVVKLTEIFRQAQESAIIINAHRINKGEYPLLNEKKKDFFLMGRFSAGDIVSTIVELVLYRLPQYVDCDKLRDIQVLTPMRKGPVGVISLNEVLQSAVNPPDKTKKEREFRSFIFREGDKVMQIKNNYNIIWRVFDEKGRLKEEGTGIYNGDEGIIERIDDIDENIKVVFEDGKTVFYDYAQLEELELSYAVTIHKSQGSEYKVIIMPLFTGPPMLLNRNLLYTAVTRAKQLVVLVGMNEILTKMVDSNKEVNRYTALTHRILKMKDYLLLSD